jgi:capsule polysaccharide export protein KpsE/RkpR
VVTDVLDAEKAAGVTDATLNRRPRRRSRWILAALAVAVLAATLGYVADNEVQSNTQFDQAHAALDATTHHIDIVLANLTTVRHELGVVNAQVSAAGTALAQDAAQLEGAQRALANARANVAQQGAMIGNLQTCLGGVEQASNALAVGDQNRAIEALDAVSTSCASAVASGG